MQKLINNPTEIKLNNNHEIDQILGNPPGWMLRWGLSLLFVAAIIFAALAWMIKYPDVIPAKVSFVTENPVVRVISERGGKIEKLLIGNEGTVSRDQLIAVLENPAVASDVEILKTFLEKTVEQTIASGFLKIKTPENLSLGNLQNGYAALVLKIKNYQQFLRQTGVPEKTATIEERIQNLKNLNANISKQKATLAEEISLAQSNFERNKKLNEIGEVSSFELEKSQTEYLRYRRQSEDFSNQIIQNDINISALKTQIIELKEFRGVGLSDKELAIREEVQRLKSEIRAWELTYLIKAPVAGKIAFSKNWTERQFLNPSEDFLTIVPTEGSGKIIGRALLPIANSGKVRTGQTANIRLDGFPFQEFGILKSTVVSFSPVPQGDNYLLELELTNGLKTTYEKTIPFRQEMRGTANIITEDRRVVDRVFDKLLSILKNT